MRALIFAAALFFAASSPAASKHRTKVGAEWTTVCTAAVSDPAELTFLLRNADKRSSISACRVLSGMSTAPASGLVKCSSLENRSRVKIYVVASDGEYKLQLKSTNGATVHCKAIMKKGK